MQQEKDATVSLVKRECDELQRTLFAERQRHSDEVRRISLVRDDAITAATTSAMAESNAKIKQLTDELQFEIERVTLVCTYIYECSLMSAIGRLRR